MSLVKDIYSHSFYQQIADEFRHVDPKFDKQQFIDSIFTDSFKELEWKQRTKHTTNVLHDFLPSHFPDAAQLIIQVIQNMIRSGKNGGLQHIIFPDYIETYGIDDFEVSVAAFEQVTQFISCEFAVRPFIIRYPEQMLLEMEKWSKHSHAQVRRLASEGSRPRLPWAMAIPFLKNDPKPILGILNNLNNDPSEMVRRSVANNLNDIAKDHPAQVLAIAQQWKNISAETDAIIKHGCRTLLKQGNTAILAFYGLEAVHFEISDLEVETPKVPIGESVIFNFRVKNISPNAQSLRLEYGLYYQKANGQLSRKVFKISEKTYQAGEINTIQRQQSFKLITTRKFYTGLHQISIIANGTESLIAEFELID